MFLNLQTVAITPISDTVKVTERERECVRVCVCLCVCVCVFVCVCFLFFSTNRNIWDWLAFVHCCELSEAKWSISTVGCLLLLRNQWAYLTWVISRIPIQCGISPLYPHCFFDFSGPKFCYLVNDVCIIPSNVMTSVNGIFNNLK